MGEYKYMNIIDEYNKALKRKVKKPKCFKDERFMYCFCGKCKQGDYALPSDFKKSILEGMLKSFYDHRRNPKS